MKKIEKDSIIDEKDVVHALPRQQNDNALSGLLLYVKRAEWVFQTTGIKWAVL